MDITAIQDCKGVINVALPDSGFLCCGFYCLFFKYLHVEVGNNRGNWAPHGWTLSLFVEPLYWKYVDHNTKSRRSTIWAGVNVVRSARLGSHSNFRRAASKAPSMKTLLNSDSTSKDTMILWFWIFSLLTVEEKWAELVTAKSEFLFRWNRVSAKKADKLYAKVVTQDAIGLNGSLALWILGKP